MVITLKIILYFEIYTRCSGIDDEEQKNKVLGVFNGETYTKYYGIN